MSRELVKRPSVVVAAPPMKKVRFIGTNETYHERVVSVIVETAIERERERLSWRARRSRDRLAAFEQKASELRRLASVAHYRIGEAKVKEGPLGEVVMEIVDELQEGCGGEFIALSRGEAKMTVLSMLQDFGARLEPKWISVLAGHDADEDLVAFSRDHKKSRRLDSILVGGFVALLLFSGLATSAVLWGFPVQLSVGEPTATIAPSANP